jgi:hypothetical protein
MLRATQIWTSSSVKGQEKAVEENAFNRLIGWDYKTVPGK